jgi:sodium pump decarboxylase gamma subunit
MLMQGLNLTIVGMLIVFIFLSLLVCILIILSRIIQKTEKLEPKEQTPAAPQPSARAAEGEAQPEERAKIAAVLAAVTHYRLLKEKG